MWESKLKIWKYTCVLMCFFFEAMDFTECCYLSWSNAWGYCTKLKLLPIYTLQGPLAWMNCMAIFNQIFLGCWFMAWSLSCSSGLTVLIEKLEWAPGLFYQLPERWLSSCRLYVIEEKLISLVLNVADILTGQQGKSETGNQNLLAWMLTINFWWSKNFKWADSLKERSDIVHL